VLEREEQRKLEMKEFVKKTGLDKPHLRWLGNSPDPTTATFADMFPMGGQTHQQAFNG
jgi:hypothetical protein